MGLFSRTLASGPGWHVSDVVCTAGPSDRPFEERHAAACIAVVTHGTFQYRSGAGAAVLSPGAVLLGNSGQCFQCGHEHGTGDRCLSFQLDPGHLDAIAAAVPGVRRSAFCIPRLPPLPGLASLLAEAEAARDDGDTAEFEELTLRLVGGVITALNGANRAALAPNRRDERRVTTALRRIEALSQDSTGRGLALCDIARKAGMSPYHFLRTFRQVVGITPHQFVLRTRLHRAAVRLLRSQEAISTIAFDAGFNDLSTFNNRFRRVIGVTPTAYRARRSG
jgi:AraC family transcriptional regulator